MFSINSIVDWFNHNQGFMIVILTTIYVISTRNIAKANRQSVRAVKDSVIAAQDSADAAYRNTDFQNEMRKQSVRIQLYEIRIKVYNNFKAAIIILINNDYSQLNIIANNIAAEKYNANKIEADFNFSEIGYVFGEEYNLKTKELLKHASKVSRQISLCKDLDREKLIKNDASNSVIIEGNGIKKSYNYKIEHTKKDEFLIKFNNEYTKLCSLLESELYLNYIG